MYEMKGLDGSTLRQARLSRFSRPNEIVGFVRYICSSRNLPSSAAPDRFDHFPSVAYGTVVGLRITWGKANPENQAADQLTKRG
jgi:hypothetical protein